MKTEMIRSADAGRKWILIDGEGLVLGRVASRIASILRGKESASFTPSQIIGDYVVLINAEKIRVTGGKMEKKVYRSHTGFPGGFREIVMKKKLEKDPYFAIKHAVKGMLPHNAMGRKLIKNLKIYTGSEHPHEAHKPVELKVGG